MGYLLLNVIYLRGSVQDHGHLKQHVVPSNVDKSLVVVDRFTLFMGTSYLKKESARQKEEVEICKKQGSCLQRSAK